MAAGEPAAVSDTTAVAPDPATTTGHCTAADDVRAGHQTSDATEMFGPANDDITMASGPPSSTPAGLDARNMLTGLPVWLTKIGSSDNPEVLLMIFEWIAITTQWSLEHWATVLAPYVTGPPSLPTRI